MLRSSSMMFGVALALALPGCLKPELALWVKAERRGNALVVTAGGGIDGPGGGVDEVSVNGVTHTAIAGRSMFVLPLETLSQGTTTLKVVGRLGERSATLEKFVPVPAAEEGLGFHILGCAEQEGREKVYVRPDGGTAEGFWCDLTPEGLAELIWIGPADAQLSVGGHPLETTAGKDLRPHRASLSLWHLIGDATLAEIGGEVRRPSFSPMREVAAPLAVTAGEHRVEITLRHEFSKTLMRKTLDHIAGRGLATNREAERGILVVDGYRIWGTEDHRLSDMALVAIVEPSDEPVRVGTCTRRHISGASYKVSHFAQDKVVTIYRARDGAEVAKKVFEGSRRCPLPTGTVWVDKHGAQLDVDESITTSPPPETMNRWVMAVARPRK